MKRNFYRLYRATLFLAIALFILSGKSITTRAIEYDKVVEIKMINKKTTGTKNYLYVYYHDEDKHVTNVRTSSKYLKAGLAEVDRETYGDRSETIQCYGTKKGSYWIYFDIEDYVGNHLSSERIKVIVCSERDSYKAFKSIKLGKVNLLNRLFRDDYFTKDITVKKGGKIKVKMRKGYKLLDISVKRTIAFDKPSNNPKIYKSYTDLVEEKVRNGSVVKLSEVGEKYQFFHNDISEKQKYNDSIFGYTYVTLTYRDKRGNERKNTITLRSKVK